MTAIYLNSTPGVLTLLGGRDNRKPSYPSFSLDTLRSLPVPDFRAVDSERMTLLGRAFDQLQDKTLQPFPQMDVDPARQQIDDVVAQILGLDPEWVDRVRRELTRNSDGNPDSPQAVVFLTSVVDVTVGY